MTARRTLELYGLVKGDLNLIREGMRVRILDENLVDRTDTSETFLVRKTAAGYIYQVRALGDQFYDTPTDTQTGLYEDERFYVVFQEIGVDPEGHPGRHPDGTLFSYPFRSSVSEAINVDLYLTNFAFEVTPPPGEYVDRPSVTVETDEPSARFLVTFNGEEPIENQVGVTEVQNSVPFTVAADGCVVVKIASVDQFGNVADSRTFVYDIEYPTALILEAVTLREIDTKRYFYQEAYLLDDTGLYTKIPKEELDLLIVEAKSNEEALDDLVYVPLEPGINNGTIFGPRFVRIGANRPGEITNQIIDDGRPLSNKLRSYVNSIIELAPSVVILRTRFIDYHGTSTGVITRTYRPVELGPVIEQIQINNGETEIFDPNVTVNVLTKGGTPQTITIGQNPILFPVDPEEPVIWTGKYYRDCQHLCNYGFGYGMGYGYEGDLSCDPCTTKLGYGYGYDRRIYETNWCFDNCCDGLVHTAFNEQTAFRLCEIDGEQCIYVRARSFNGTGLPIVVLCVNLNLEKPTLELDPVCTELKQTASTYTLSGLKGIDEAVWINGEQIIPPDDTILWSHTVRLSSGNNKFVIFSRNAKGASSDPVEININYEFVFTGVQSAIVRADAEGHWEVAGIGFNSPACEEEACVWEILAEIPDQCAIIRSDPRNVYIVEEGLEVDFVSPQHRAPVCENDQKVEFGLINPSPLCFFGPYTVTADEDGEWAIDGVALDPSLAVDSVDPNIQIVATALNQDSTEHSSAVNVNVQVVQSVELQLDGCVLGRDFAPPFMDLNCLMLNDLSDGKHSLTLVVNDYEGFSTRASKSFIVDTKNPVIQITSPVEDQGIYTTEPPVLEYEVDLSTYETDQFGNEATVPLLRTTVYIDGVNVGKIESGQRLPPLTDGIHIIRVEVEAYSRDESRVSAHVCDGYGDGYGYDGYGYGYGPTLPCRISSDEVVIEYLRPIDIRFGAAGNCRLNIGNDINGLFQANAIFDEFRILNKASSDANILEDWRLLLNGIRFNNSQFTSDLTDEQLAIIEEKELNSARISLPTETLVLMHFDNSTQSELGVDNRIETPNGSLIETGTIVNPGPQQIVIPDGTPLDLRAEGNPIIDQRSAINQLAIDVFVERGQPVDEDLILDSIDRIIPARGEALVEFVEVETEE